MDKKLLIKILSSMLVDWQDSYKHFTKETILSNHTEDGFCFWIERNKLPLQEIKAELKKDCLKEPDPQATNWYKIWITHHYDREVFRPRIDHLHRTITRLKKELKN